MASATAAPEQLRRLEDPATTLDERIAAANALGKAKDRAALDALARFVEITDERLRRSVTEAIRAADGVEVFNHRLVDLSASPELRREAATVLRHLKDPRSVGALAAGLTDTDAELRARCAHALAVFGASDAQPALLEALGDDSSDVRYFAVLALEQAPNDATRAALNARLDVEADPTVRDELLRVLDQDR